jgi:D-sedoheptulose 7-phosphate isomerase
MNWSRFESDALAVVREVAGLQDRIESVATEIARRLAAGGKVLFCGNGGSAADAQHMAAEFVNRFLINRKPYAGLALTTDASILTSIANDFSFDEVFAKQVLAHGRPGDVLIAFSTSGRSPSMIRAVEAAKSLKDVYCVAIAGSDQSPMVKGSDAALCIQSVPGTPRIQEGHQLFMHIICQLVEERLEHAEETV